MCVATVITGGFGSFGDVAHAITQGFLGTAAPPTPTPTPTTGVSRGKLRKRRGPPIFAAAPDRIIVEGSLFVVERRDGFHATGSVYESDEQIRQRRNRRTLAILLLS